MNDLPEPVRKSRATPDDRAKSCAARGYATSAHWYVLLQLAR